MRVIRQLFSLISACFLSQTLCGQYFQQQVDYRIDVSLDPVSFTLHGNCDITYRNNSPDQLRKLAFHLYPNAYSSDETAFARQQLRLGNTDFHFSNASDRGFIDSLNFIINGQKARWKLDAQHVDIAWVTLPETLEPGESITIATPFRLKFPRAFSRLGRIGDTYQVTQWYPKPAVYDQDGWQAMPYLAQGEFYSEFGTYDVQITLPANYIVAATGELISPGTSIWLDSLASIKNIPPLASEPPFESKRIWHYRAENCHDFAWFADKRFAVRKKTISIDEKDVDCMAFFTVVESELWENATDHIADAITFYSQEVGPYPYPQMTAVQVPLGKDFGMEYPMITSINLAGDAKTLDGVIAHEVGHNWFYGILASNERLHPWMDEGINSYYENAYILRKYGSWSENFLLWKPTPAPGISDEQRLIQHESLHQRLGIPDSNPEFSTEVQNFTDAYSRPAIAMSMLREYLGSEAFDNAMHKYYQTWKFKHPGPGDLRDILETECSCDLGWFFTGLMGTPQLIDYKLNKRKGNNLTLSNRGDIKAPLHLLAYQDTDIVRSKWIPGFSGTQEVEFNTTGADHIQIYKDNYTLDRTPANNLLLLNGNRAKRAQLKIRIPGGKAQPGKQYLNLVPLPGWNDADHFMAGIALSNTYWPPGKLQWALVPMYSFQAKTIVGAGDLRYLITPAAKAWTLEAGLGIKSFHFEQDTHYNFFDRYIKVAPHIRLTQRGKGTSTASHALQYRVIYVHQRYGQGLDFFEKLWEWKTRAYLVHEFRYDREHQRNLSSGRISATLRAGDGFVRLGLDVNHKMIYAKGNKAIYFHAFAGALPYHNNPDANVTLMFNGIQSTGFYSRDYLYDELLFARNASKGLASQMVFMKDAQLKTLYNGGLSNAWLVGAGIALQPPLPLPVYPYMDFAIFSDPFDEDVQLSYSGGLAIVLWKDIFEIYLPLVESKDIRTSLTYDTRDTFWKKISILLSLKDLHPFQFKGY